MNDRDAYISLVMEEYSLPELPEQGDGDRQLILFRRADKNIVLAADVKLADAQDYCSREDIHGDGWFVGFDTQ